ncbi:MAG: hypothetical protein H6736_09810 [Alphaproteobacteria bacterium]|nr:hypothetical protein [Alphaproteobacteria bacterium]MCB9692095.1 hypothetical protein [Alphaproteobacteria bacterium]
MRWLRAVVLCLGLTLAHTASATSMVAVGLEELAADSTAVVYARVGTADPVLTPSRAYTDTRLHVETVLAGQAPALLNVRQVGGVHGDHTIVVPGDGRLTPGDHVVAFLRKVDGRWYLTAMAQSVWHVEGTGRLARVHRELEGIALFERSTDGTVQEATESLPEPGTFEDLAEAVRHLQMGQP